MILVDEFITLNMSEAFKEMFFVVIQLGAILAVVVLYFKSIWPFKKEKEERKKKKRKREEKVIMELFVI